MTENTLKTKPVNNNELENAIKRLLEAVADILATAGAPFNRSHIEVKELVQSSSLLEPDHLKRRAYNLIKIGGEISHNLTKGQPLELNNSPKVPTKTIPLGRNQEVYGQDSGNETPPHPILGKVAGERPIIPSNIQPFLYLASSLASQVASIRPNHDYGETVATLTAQAEAGLPLDDVLEKILFLSMNVREDLLAERAKNYKQISDVYRTLEQTERSFVTSIDASQTYITDVETDFTNVMENGLRDLGFSLKKIDQIELDSLCLKLAEKVSRLNNSVSSKKSQDQARVEALILERKDVEKRLDKSRRDYETFSRQSREMLEEIEILR
ncbi:MAG: hypothetical protein ACRCTY_09545, partial [Candidatus Adiutrix sp.]